MANKKLITDVIKELGIPANIQGYRYLRYAVELVADDFSAIDKVTKFLYPNVANKFGTTSSKVERAIRHAIETSWLRGNKDLITKLFGYSVSADKGKPTNSEFIAAISDYIIMQNESCDSENGEVR